MHIKNRGLYYLRSSLTFLISLSAFSAAEESKSDFESAWGENYSVQTPSFSPYTPPNDWPRTMPSGWVVHWNEMAVNASGLDHTPLPTALDRVFGEQLGPGRASRAVAIIQIAIFEALNAIENKYESYAGVLPVPTGMETSLRAAIAQAAHDAAVGVFPSQASIFDAELASELAQIPNGMVKKRGIDLGKRAAAMVLAKRANDGSQISEPRLGIGYFPSDKPGIWRQDPISLLPVALGAFWNQVKPFALTSASQFRAPKPPALNSPAYAIAFNEVKRLGGDGIHTPTERTPDQTEAGIYWAYDGTPSMCAPPRLYNQLVLHIAKQMNTDFMELSRLLALVNMAMADSGIAGWESKYFYKLWRPVTGIREADPGTGLTGLGDGNPYTPGDTNFHPLGAPASNLNGPNFTPPFPAYPSGHATFGGALFQVLRRFYGRDDIAFTFTSDEFNGITRDNNGNIRPLKPRTFSSFSQAEEENGQSRIYLGIHWAFDKTAGIAQGRQVANWVLDHVYPKKVTPAASR